MENAHAQTFTDQMTALLAFQRETLAVHDGYLRKRLVTAHTTLEAAQMDVASAQKKETHAEISVLPICLKQLPEPDFMDFEFLADRVCVIMDNGTDTTVELARVLAGMGWHISVVSPAELETSEPVEMPTNVAWVVLESMDGEYLAETLPQNIGGFIYLHPQVAFDDTDGFRFSEQEKTYIRNFYLMIRHLHEPLNCAQGRPFFMTVTQLDGQLGIGEGTSMSPLCGGLFGLTKSLNLEWAGVFCRAVDVSPRFRAKEIVAHLIAELHDPDLRLVEVGVHEKGRFTISVKQDGV